MAVWQYDSVPPKVLCIVVAQKGTSYGSGGAALADYYPGMVHVDWSREPILLYMRGLEEEKTIVCSILGPLRGYRGFAD